MKLVLLVCLAFVLAGGRMPGAESRGARVPVGPLQESQTASNAGVFIGVNEFRKDTKIETLRYAVNDAVAQAYYFSLQLKIIPPANVHLLLSGSPTPQLEARYMELIKAGVNISTATKADVWKAVGQIQKDSRSSNDFLIVSISSHGFFDSFTHTGFVLPEDGLLDKIQTMGVSLKELEETLDQARAAKHLILVDACRANVRTGAKGVGGGGLERFHELLSQRRGRATLNACGTGQKSYEDDSLQHGVFTAKLIEALEGHAGREDQQFLTLGQVAGYVNREVREWVRSNKRDTQEPLFSDGGDSQAQDIPLGTSLKFSERRENALGILGKARAAQRLVPRESVSLTALIEDEVVTVAGKLAGEKLKQLLGQIELLDPPKPTAVENFVAWWQGTGRKLVDPGAEIPAKAGDSKATHLASRFQVLPSKLTADEFSNIIGLGMGNTTAEVEKVLGKPNETSPFVGVFGGSTEFFWSYRAGLAELKVTFSSTKAVQSIAINANPAAWLSEKGVGDPKLGLFGKSKREIEKIMGEPSKTYGSMIWYEGKSSDVQFTCFERNRFECSSIVIKWKRTGKSPE